MPGNPFSLTEDWRIGQPLGSPNVDVSNPDDPAAIPHEQSLWQQAGDWWHGRGRDYLDAFARAGRYLDPALDRSPASPGVGRSGGAGVVRGGSRAIPPYQSRQPENLAGRADQFGIYPRFYTYGSFAEGGPVQGPVRGSLTPHDLMLLQNFAPGLAQGGQERQSPHLLRGPGGGQDDNIDAKVSPGEYVMSAEDVSMLGDGSNEEGAKRLDKMRGALRQHKYGTSKFPPKARNPLSYLRRAS